MAEEDLIKMVDLLDKRMTRAETLINDLWPVIDHQNQVLNQLLTILKAREVKQ